MDWRRDGDDVVVSATIPPGVTAEVDLPDLTGVATSGTHEWRVTLPEPVYGPPATVRDLMDDPARWERFVEGTIAAPLRGMVHFTDEASVGRPDGGAPRGPRGGAWWTPSPSAVATAAATRSRPSCARA